MRRAWRDFAALVLPTACAGCDLPDVGLCGECLAELAAPARRVDEDAPRIPDGVEAWAGPAFEGPVREVLTGYKDRGRRDMTGRLALALACIIAAGTPSGTDRISVVPVPSSRRAVRRRGEDTLWRCAQQACRVLTASGTPAGAVRVLRTTRTTADQAGLSAGRRAVNKQGSMAVRRWFAYGTSHARAACPPGHCLVLVDDVVTTGATIAEAHRALSAARIPVARVAAIAATPRRDSASETPGRHGS